jgi:hypothetical protein
VEGDVALTKTIGGSILDPAAYDLGVVSPAEEMWLRRHRLRREVPREDGPGPRYLVPTQREVASSIGISAGAYVGLENGTGAVLTLADARAVVAWVRTVEPTLAELCFVARRRSGLSLVEIATEATFAASKPTYLKKEAEADPDVVAFWTARGFRFP